MFQLLSRNSRVHLLAAAGGSGLATYILLAVFARGLGTEGYADFSWFWSLTVIAGLGLYLPIEQEATRVLVSPDLGVEAPRRSVIRMSTATGLIAAALVGLGLFVFGSVLWRSTPDAPLVAVALVSSCIAYAVQYTFRADLAARGHLSRYAALLAIEAVVRVGGAVVAVIAAPRYAPLACSVITVASIISVVITRIGRGNLRPIRRLITSRKFILGAARLAAGGLVIQILLNLPPVLATAFSHPDGAPSAALNAGQLLIVISLTRIPLFVYQALQASILPVFAKEWADGKQNFGRSAAVFVLGAWCAAAVWGTIVILLGQGIIRLIFGPSFVPASIAVLLPVVLGVVMVTFGLVVSDLLLSTGGHTEVLAMWGSATVAATVALIAVTDASWRTSAPVVAGSAVALLCGILLIVRRFRSRGTEIALPAV